MSNTNKTEAHSKRIIFSMGGKGGVGKTSLMVSLIDWFEANQTPFTMLDLDSENKARGSLKHYYNGAALKVNIHTPAGLDAFVDQLDSRAPVVLADMGAGSGQVAHDWFDSMHEGAAGIGITFTAIALITPDPASVESLLVWANKLQKRVNYLVVENSNTLHPDFSYWRNSEQAIAFREKFKPVVLSMGFRLPELEGHARQHGVTLSQVATRKNHVPELQKASLVMRASTYQKQLFSEFEKAKALLLP